MTTKIVINRSTGKKRVADEYKKVKATIQNPIRLDPADVKPLKDLNGEEIKVKYVHIWKQADLQHLKYGMCTVPLAEQWADGSLMDTGQYLDILNRYRFKTKNAEGVELQREEWRPVGRLMSRDYALIPHQLLIEKVSDAGFDVEKSGIRYSRGGNRMYLEVKSKKLKTEQVKVGDVVQVGAMIRNSIDGSMAVGIDGFTYRLACMNGAVMAGDDSMRTTFVHLGKNVLDNVKTAIDEVIQYVRNKIAIYKLAADTKVTKPLALQFFDIHTVPERYVPDWITPRFETNKETKVRELEDVKLSDYNKTFWDLFNALTENYWHKMDRDKKMSVENAFNKEIQLHNAMEIVVTQPNPNYGLLTKRIKGTVGI